MDIPAPPSVQPNLLALSPSNPPTSSTAQATPKPPEQSGRPSMTTAAATPDSAAGNPNQAQPASASPATSSGEPTAASPETPSMEMAATAPDQAAQTKLEELRAGLVFEAAGTTDAEAAAAKTAWLANAQTQAGETGLLSAAPGSITVDSNIRLCVDNPPLNGLVGVLVNPEGGIVGNPKLLKSTGYENLNQAALNAVRQSPFEAATQFTTYEFTVNVGYDAENCVAAEQVLQTATTAAE
jgi:hypothetical protein